MGAEEELVVREAADEAGVARLVLNRPGRGNALNRKMLAQLAAGMAAMDADGAVRAVLLCGAGRHFCTGIDVAELRQLPSGAAAASSPAAWLREQIVAMQADVASPERCRKPVVAALHGACIGAGLELAAACDVRLATSDARLALPEVRLGITADLGGLQRLPHIIGAGRAAYLALTAADVDGGAAVSMGLVSAALTSVEELQRAAYRVAASIAAMPAQAAQGTKHVLLRSRAASVDDGLHYVATLNAAALLTSKL